MIAEKVKSTNIGVGVGIIVQMIGNYLSQHGPALAALSWPVMVIGIAIFIWGCFNYAEGKGYSKYLGLLGLASCIGLIVLIFLPDQCKDGKLPGTPNPINYGGQQSGVWPPPPNDQNEPPK